MTVSAIYTEAENFVKSNFTGAEAHQDLRMKVLKTPKAMRSLIACAIQQEFGASIKMCEAVFWILNSLSKYPESKCEFCNCNFSLTKFVNVREGYLQRRYCSTKCRSRDPKYASRLAKTNLERYGHTSNMWGSNRVKTKRKWVEVYGVDSPMKRPEIIEKCRLSNLQSLGVEWPGQSPVVRAKMLATSVERYGFEERFGKSKSKITCLERYGVENPMQHPTIFQKAQKYKRRSATFPSGAVFAYQGYENVAVFSLLASGYTECQISIGDVIKIPSIEYWNPAKKRLCVYFPDIFIQHENRLIEVKSTWTLKSQFAENIAKHEAAKALGFKHEIWVCSAKKIIEIIH